MKLGVIDAETDPFRYGRKPEAFAWGFFDGKTYVNFWGKDATSELITYLGSLNEPHVLYAHNGGKFDFFYLLPWLENPLRIINGRIVEASLGAHKLRDSYAILPIQLKEYQKDEIDYANFEASKREQYKNDILHYLAKDCEYLFALVAAFRDRFGAKLTIGSTALTKLREYHPFPSQDANHDALFRPFYFGGRCEYFERGILRDDWSIFDVNSMYPTVMRNFQHPKGKFYAHVKNPKIQSSGMLRGFGSEIYFAQIEATSAGALPMRTKNGLSFPHGTQIFNACSHEIVAACELGLLKIHSIGAAFVPHQHQSFVEFVDTYSAEKIAAKKSGDKAKEIFSKLLLNSAYGKTASNPLNYSDFHIGGVGEKMEPPWKLHGITDDVWLWSKPIDEEDHSYVDVAIGASITSGSRATLLRGIAGAKRPIYCDTDSIICRDISSVKIDSSELGAWKLEGRGDMAAIAAKKLYAVFDGKECVKRASKGVRLDPKDIVRAARGEIVAWQNDRPSFSLSGSVNFIARTIDTSKTK